MVGKRSGWKEELTSDEVCVCEAVVGKERGGGTHVRRGGGKPYSDIGELPLFKTDHKTDYATPSRLVTLEALNRQVSKFPHWEFNARFLFSFWTGGI